MPQPPGNNNQRLKSIDDSMQAALTRALDRMPGVQRPLLMPTSDNIITRHIPGDFEARTGRYTGHMLYNPDAVKDKSPNEMDDLMTHELTHTRQAQTTPWWQKLMQTYSNRPPAGLPASSPINNSYAWNPLEMEAFQNERDRNMLTPGYSDPLTGARDIPLPKPRR